MNYRLHLFPKIVLLLFITSAAMGQSAIAPYQKALAEAETAIDSIDNIVTIVDHYIYRNIDSAGYYLDITEKLTTREQDTIGLSIYHLLLAKFNKTRAENQLAIANLLEAEKLSRAADYHAGLELIWVELGYVYRRSGQLDSSNYYLRKVYENSENDEDRYSALNGIALNYKSVGAYDEALEGFYEILEATAPDNHRDFATIYSNIALVALGQGDEEKATRMFARALSEAKKTDNIKEIGYAEKMLGNRYFESGSYDSALILLKSAMEKFKLVDSKFEQAKTSINLGLTYTDLKEWTKAAAEFDTARAILEASKNSFSESFYLKSFAQYQYLNPAIPTTSALATLDKAEKLALSNKLTDELKTTYEMKSAYLEKQDPSQALAYFKKFHHLSDSINTLKNRNYTSILETRFETAQKEEAIRNLEQEQAINVLQLQQQQTALYASAGIVFLLLLGGLLFFQHRRLQHRSQTENLQHRLLRIQMNPHFIFNALMSIQHFMMKNKAEQAGLYLSRFARLMRQTLELSREETIDLEEEREMLENYIEIQRMRADNRFEYEIIIDPKLIEKEVKIPPMYAQPFVENAIEHGDLGTVENGKLTVHFRENNNKMEVVIEDNGKGIKSDPEKKSHKSLSTIITKERLQILEKRFKGQFDLSVSAKIDSIRNSGTKVRIELPLLSE